MRRRTKVYRLPGRQKQPRQNLDFSMLKPALSATALLLLALLFWVRPHHAATVEAIAQPISLPPAIAGAVNSSGESVEARYMFSGTVVLDRIVSAAAKTGAGYNYEQPFSHMADFGSYDAAVADLECPVTSEDFSAAAQIGVDSPKFNCRPEWLPTLKKYFPIINLSSNHTYDRGADGYTQTVNNLSQAGFQIVGNYNPHADPNNNCKILTMPVRVKKTDGSEKQGNLPIAFCSFNYKILFSPSDGEMEQIQKYQKIMPVFGMLNSGSEYLASAGEMQRNLAHKMIDYGSEFVIANGTHWVQDSEAYKGKLITYSLGNFIFDQSDDESRRSANVFVNLKSSYDQNLAKWLTLGDQCKQKPASCENLIESSNLPKPTLNLSFDMTAAQGGFRTVVHKADSSLQKSVEDRMRWAETLQGLSAP
jgi:hypothetical protein